MRTGRPNLREAMHTAAQTGASRDNFPPNPPARSVDTHTHMYAHTCTYAHTHTHVRTQHSNTIRTPPHRAIGKNTAQHSNTWRTAYSTAPRSTVPHHVTSTPGQVRSRHVTSSHVTSCHVTPPHLTSRHVTSRHVTSGAKEAHLRIVWWKQ